MLIVSKAANSSAPNRDDAEYGFRRSPGRRRGMLASLTTQVCPPPAISGCSVPLRPLYAELWLTLSFQQKPWVEVKANASIFQDCYYETGPDVFDRHKLLRTAAALATTS